MVRFTAMLLHRPLIPGMYRQLLVVVLVVVPLTTAEQKELLSTFWQHLTCDGPRILPSTHAPRLSP